jgi:hypothetical protein
MSVYFNIRNTLPKFGTFLLGHPVYIYIYTGLFISPSGTSELRRATTKTDTAERSIQISRESLQVSFCVLDAVAYLQVLSLGGSRDETWCGQRIKKPLFVLEFAKFAKFDICRVTKGGHIEHL